MQNWKASEWTRLYQIKIKRTKSIEGEGSLFWKRRTWIVFEKRIIKKKRHIIITQQNCDKKWINCCITQERHQQSINRRKFTEEWSRDTQG